MCCFIDKYPVKMFKHYPNRHNVLALIAHNLAPKTASIPLSLSSSLSFSLSFCLSLYLSLHISPSLLRFIFYRVIYFLRIIFLIFFSSFFVDSRFPLFSIPFPLNIHILSSLVSIRHVSIYYSVF